ncbi:PREDICTED: alpha-2-macroglobulin-like [Thamnophis sirtalis]|uniref:Alpha-2-macroglobulin-like n=1 Tax=Thamnophis sirtalis TaxID=35019 RepID=A0A6I9YQ57_9SAUR|nr:PREDICTED: alpha-2-macroglobulin-like [Thamnophis sirtalis]
MSRGDIVKSGTHPLKEKQSKGIFNLDLLVDIKTAPLARLLVYTLLDNGELVAHSANFPVEPCFANKVDLRFAEREGLPGSQINLHLAAAQNSLCAIHAVDESVFLLKPEAELSAQTVYDLLPLTDLRGYYYKSENLEDPDTNPCVPPKKIIVDGIRYETDTYSYGEGDAYTILRDIGFKTFTSAQIYKPNICSRPERHYPMAYMERGPANARLGGMSMDNSAEPVETTIRRFFPETWIWSLKSLGSESELTLPVTIPDTITDWRAGAFCLSPAVGFGLAQTIFLTAIQPFFVEVTQPYSVIRGEDYVMKATIYNYLKRSIQVGVSLLLSPDYIATPLDKEQGPHCLPVDGRKTFSWKVTPKTIGVQRQLNYKHADGSYSTFGERHNEPGNHSVVRNALFCLETVSQQKDIPIYTQALLAYAFALAHKDDKVTALLQSLQQKAVKGDDGSIHWERIVKPEVKKSLYYEPQALSAEVEMTSYVLLTHLTMLRRAASVSQDDLAIPTKIVTWMTKQQNPSGGFASTQKDDPLTRIFPPQTTLRYNVLPHPGDDPFALTVTTNPETCVGVKAHREFDIAINVSYVGKRPSTNMVILNIKMVSGFAPNRPSVKELEKQALIKRVDMTPREVVVYFEKVSAEATARERVS